MQWHIWTVVRQCIIIKRRLHVEMIIIKTHIFKCYIQSNLSQMVFSKKLIFQTWWQTCTIQTWWQTCTIQTRWQTCTIQTRWQRFAAKFERNFKLAGFLNALKSLIKFSAKLKWFTVFYQIPPPPWHRQLVELKGPNYIY